MRRKIEEDKLLGKTYPLPAYLSYCLQRWSKNGEYGLGICTKCEAIATFAYKSQGVWDYTSKTHCKYCGYVEVKYEK